MNRITSLFDDRDVQLIQSIPLSRKYCMNSWMWVHSNQGAYSVKSGYWVLSSRPPDSIVYPDFPEFLWRKLWKAKVPRKVQEFTWRLC